jgi:hypothetical protein
MNAAWRVWSLAPLAGCLTLDGFVYNPVHCTEVGPATCAEEEEFWSRVCTPCEQPYDLTRDYPWREQTLPSGATVRPIGVVERFVLRTEDGEGELDALWIPGWGDAAQTTLVYNHGNYAGIEHYLPRVRLLHELGYSQLVWDYRGYGKSEPAETPSPAQLMADARLVLEEASLRAPDPGRVVPYGFSLGALPAVEMALSGKVCALVLEAPFTSLGRISARSAGVGMGEALLSEGLFDNHRKMRDVRAPTLLFAAARDELFPLDEHERLLERAAGPTRLVVVEGAYHGLSKGGVVEQGLAPYGEALEDWLVKHNCR